MDALDNPIHSLAQHIMKLPELRVRARKLNAQVLTPERAEKIQQIIKDCFELEERMKDWVPMSGENWVPRTAAYVPSVPEDLENALAWIGPVHVYPTVHQPSTINKQRSARIVTAVLIQDCVMKLFPDAYKYDRQYLKAQHIVQSQVDDICYSIPALLGVNVEDPNWVIVPSSPSNDFFASIGAFQLIWPTSVAYGARGISDSQRRWLHGRLDVIGRRWGFEQALLVKHML